MTYHCGLGPGMAALGIAPRDPFISCDHPGCEATKNGLNPDGMPYVWMRNGKAPPGWQRIERGSHLPSNHLCKDHRGKVKP